MRGVRRIWTKERLHKSEAPPTRAAVSHQKRFEEFFGMAVVGTLKGAERLFRLVLKLEVPWGVRPKRKQLFVHRVRTMLIRTMLMFLFSSGMLCRWPRRVPRAEPFMEGDTMHLGAIAIEYIGAKVDAGGWVGKVRRFSKK